MTPGIHQDLPNAEYHKAPGISKTGLKELDKSPAHYQAWLAAEKSTTPAMLIGQAFHLYILEPALFDERVVVWNGRKAGKKWDEFQAGADGKIILGPEDVDQLDAMKAAILQSHTARGLIAKGVAEQSIFWDDPDHGFRLKARPDWEIENLSILMDLKSCQDASPEGFSRACVNFGYDLQASLYLEGRNVFSERKRFGSFVFLCVEKAPPYAVGIYRASPEFLTIGYEKLDRLKRIYAECLKTDRWPGPYPDAVQSLDLPAWAA